MKKLEEKMSIQTDEFELEFTGSDESKLYFKLTDKKTGVEEKLDFSIKYWASFVQYLPNGHQNSGDYIFRPIKGEFEPLTYSKYVEGTISKGETKEQMDFFFAADNKHTEQQFELARVHVSIDKDLHVLKFDVDLESLPPAIYDGYEVIANFHVENFDNNQTFYTDSNGLEMQKRILNYRPTWDLVNTNYKDSLENVTANYYPINSAISMEDGDRVFTVMNGRSQGGSALSPGNIELMQNRRIPADDARGMGEYLDEKDALGNGIRVPATYYVQLFDKTKMANN